MDSNKNIISVWTEPSICVWRSIFQRWEFGFKGEEWWKKQKKKWESLQDERRDYEDIDELKEIICDWLDDSIERDGFQEDSKVSSVTTDDKFYFLIHDVVMTHPENTERQDLLFSIERVEGQTEETTK